MPRPRRKPETPPDPRRNPGLLAPARRPSCTSYDRCLSRAARLDALSLGCTGCTRYTPQVLNHETALADASGCRALLLAAYCAPIPAEAPGEPDSMDVGAEAGNPPGHGEASEGCPAMGAAFE